MSEGNTRPRGRVTTERIEGGAPPAGDAPPMHVHLLDAKGNVTHHYCEEHYRKARAAGKLDDHLGDEIGTRVVRADHCGGRCDACPRPEVP